MKRILVLFVVAVLAGTAIAATVQYLIPKDGPRIGQRSASFEVDGVRYVTTDKATLDAIDRVTQPQTELGLQQARIGAEQARVGAKQRDAKTETERRALEKEQHDLAGQQLALAEQQQHEMENIDKELEKIFRNAVRTGAARRR